MKNIAYIIFHKNEKSDTEFVSYLVPFDGSKDIIAFIKPRARKIPNKIYFQANFRLLNRTDFPNNDVKWPIISKKMYNTLLSCGNFPHKIYPIIMVDDTVPWEERTDKNGILREDIINTDYVAIQITEFTDVFDYENSKYTESGIFPGKVGIVEKLVLKIPENGLPPLFLLKEKSTSILVSKEAKEILEKEGIRGIEYDDLSQPF